MSLSSPDSACLQVESQKFSSSGPYSLCLAPGCCAVLNGIFGVGKTRLLGVLADIDRSKGRVMLNGRQREQYTPPEWRRLVAMIPAGIALGQPLKKMEKRTRFNSDYVLVDR